MGPAWVIVRSCTVRDIHGSHPVRAVRSSGKDRLVAVRSPAVPYTCQREEAPVKLDDLPVQAGQ